MEQKVMNLLQEKPIVVSRILLSNYKGLGITDSELLILIILTSYQDKIVYNPEEFASFINGSKHEIMKLINSLIEKNIISLEVEKNNHKAFEYISLDLLYKKLFNIVIKNDDEEESIDNTIFDTFEKELGRTMSPMEYEQVKEWITSGNSNEMIISALKEAVLNGVSNFRYIDSILNEWNKKGYKSKNDIIKDREMYRSKKSKIEVYDTDWLNE